MLRTRPSAWLMFAQLCLLPLLKLSPRLLDTDINPMAEDDETDVKWWQVRYSLNCDCPCTCCLCYHCHIRRRLGH